MANLPSNTFKFNYNAKDYNSTTHTFPKTSGQLFNNDLVLSGSSFPVVYEDYLEFTSNTNACKGFYSDSFDRTDTTTGRSLTFIYKTADWGAGGGNLFANRYNHYNYMVRPTVFHTIDGSFLRLSPTTNPQICVIRVSSNGYSERKFVDSNGITINSVTSSTIDYGSAAGGFGFFAGYADRNTELFKGKFYWMYCSFETLTDEEVLQVIKYNEGIDFELSTSALTFTSEASSSTVTVSSSENPWTATTQDDWITLSQSTGNTGETTITVSVSSSIFSDRTGTVSFTDGEETIYLTVNQKKNTSVRLRNIYLENNRIDKMYCNGDLIYQSLIKPVFILSTNELEIETGQTGTFTITANDRWTITAPEWLTVSQNSGYGNATITVTMGSVESAGTIDVTCYNKTKSISVESQKDYSKEYLTFRVSSAGTINWIQTGSTSKTIQYSKNNGSWTSITSSTAGTSFNVVAGDVVRFKGSNTQYASSTSRYACFYNSTARFSIEGNIMSLISGDNFANSKSISAQYTFYMLFRGRSGMGATSAENLILPATTLAQHCYRDMFYECYLLTTPPKILPATTLQNYCYSDMFAGCRVLEKGPDLPAPTLVSNCYYGMFRVCPKLNYIKCLATSISATSCTSNWTNGVYGIGTFVKATSMTGWPTGTNGIPSGWTVIEE